MDSLLANIVSSSKSPFREMRLATTRLVILFLFISSKINRPFDSEITPCAKRTRRFDDFGLEITSGAKWARRFDGFDWEGSAW